MTDDAVTDIHTESTEPAASRPRRWPWVLALLILFGIAAVVLFAIRTVRDASDEQAGMRSQTQALDERLYSLERGLEQVREGQQRLIQRLDSTTATHQVLREELLGMSERAGLLEDAVARLAQSRMSGDSVLRLNEAEFLLSMGAERLKLYADVPSAIQALSLAEGTLAGLDDPALATLRQTLAQELIQLRELPPDPRPQLRAELASLAGQLTALPPSREDAVALGKAEDSRARQLLGQLITVRRVDPQASLLGPAQRQAALSAIALQLDLAQAALARPDEVAFRAALDRIEQNSRGLFDTQADSVVRWNERLAQLRHVRLSPQLPALGATLNELRGLRAMRHVASGGLHLPAPDDSAQPADETVEAEAVETEAVETGAVEAEAVETEAAASDNAETGSSEADEAEAEASSPEAPEPQSIDTTPSEGVHA